MLDRLQAEGLWGSKEDPRRRGSPLVSAAHLDDPPLTKGFFREIEVTVG